MFTPEEAEKMKERLNKVETKVEVHGTELKNLKSDVSEIKNDLKENNKTTKANLFGIVISVALMVLSLVLTTK